MKKLLLIGSIAVAALVGCASSGVMQIGENKYMLADQNSMYWQGAAVMKDILPEANAFCAKQGKSLEILDTKIKDASGGLSIQYATASITFTCK